MFRFIASIVMVSALGVFGGVLAAGHFSWLVSLGILILTTTVGTGLVVFVLGRIIPHPCVAGNMIFLFWWLPFLSGCWAGAIIRWLL